MSAVEPIAIIGMSGIFPDATNVDHLWENLCAGRSSISEVPGNRGWKHEDYFDQKPQTRGKTYASRGGFIDGIDLFDPFFFEITPSYALFMDPSARLFLQEAWRAIEDAGYASSALANTRCGMYFCAKGDYSSLVQKYEETYLASTDTYVPARLAYYLNLLGPAVSIDTACSSTLTAIAYACDALTLGNCEMAIVGGGSINSTPNALVTSSQLMLFSPTDSCRAFDAAADGTVLGEAIGALVLKPLSRARADGDNIQGVIRGWGTNQDGRTNGQTAPSAKSQARLQRDVYEKFGINPEDITMVEAHGTGTKLGDPIEVQAMCSSFGEFTRKRNYCALGSIKTNIGHTFFGAGVTSVIKTLLSLRHGMIPPTLNFQTINPSIKIKDSPFYVNTELREWLRIDGKPRSAAVNAFGATGTNAHLVIQEYLGDEQADGAQDERPDEQVVLVLSARTGDELLARARQLMAWLDERGSQARNSKMLADLAYTLQLGRDAMRERLGFVASTLDEAREKLSSFADAYGQDFDQLGWCRGTLPPSAIARAELTSSSSAAVADSLIRHDSNQLAELWAGGATVDWAQLYRHGRSRQRISLPTYPFVGERYWIDESFRRPGTMASGQHLHPLLHRNASNLNEIGFSSTFTGEEFFLRDHVIAGRKLLPGVAYLELARAAVAEIIADTPGKHDVIMGFKNVVWIQPFVFGPERATVRIALAPIESDDTDRSVGLPRGFEFEVYGEAQGEFTRFCQGQILFELAAVGRKNDVSLIKDRCGSAFAKASEIYPLLAQAGFALGPGHRGLDHVSVGHREVLAHLIMPSVVSRDFFLHPSMMDSSLQASAGLRFGSDEEVAGVPLPFALEQMSVLRPCGESMWAWVRPSESVDGTESLSRIDIDLMDDDGVVCVEIRALTSRELERRPQTVSPSTPSIGAETLLLRSNLVAEDLPESSSQEWADRRVLFLASEDSMGAADILEARNDIAEVVRISVPKGDGSAIASTYERAATSTFLAVQSVLRGLLGQKMSAIKVLFQVVIDTSAQGYCLEGLAALLKSAAAENARFHGRLVSFSGALDEGDLVERVISEARCTHDGEVVHERAGRFIRRYEALDEIIEAGAGSAAPWRADGVYFMAGGAGGLGLLLAREIASSCQGGSFVLAGRSEPDAGARRMISEIEALGARVMFARMDVSDASSVRAAVESAKHRFGHLTGVFHLAGTLSDGYIAKTSVDDLMSVLSPKVSGLVNLDVATDSEHLDFFISFSSLAGTFGNAGQAGYAAANAFMDQYVSVRHDRIGQGRDFGRSASLNWPLWRDGGMKIDPAYERLMANTSGLRPLPTERGMTALRAALATDLPQILVVHRGAAESESSDEPEAKQRKRALVSDGDTAELKEQAVRLTQKFVAQLVRIEESRIGAQIELSEFGLDSITLTKLSNRLHDECGISLSPTVFFEYSTIDEFAGFLVSEFSGELEDFIRGGGGARREADAGKSQSDESAGNSLEDAPRLRGRVNLIRRFGMPSDARAEKGPSGKGNEPIAIIGMSAQFPMARNYREFWKNLVDERDCITEIPPDRWDWKALYGDPHGGTGLTNIKWGGFIDGIGDWDPAFFSVSPREAEMMDPQMRLLMTHVWRAIEDAGYSPSSLWGSNTALVVGTADSGYSALYKVANLSNDGSGIPVSMGPNRVSYFLNLHGPSEPVETACSSSLVAIGRAVRLLQSGESDLALTGGIQLIPTPAKHVSFSQAGILSEDGRCKTFSDKANGYVRSEGIGILLLKRLSDARRDGDAIYGTIIGVAENHGGRANSLTAPNPRAQAMLLENVYGAAGIDPRTVGYIEAHGTGTMLGDPIEINGLKTAFKALYADTAGGKFGDLQNGPRCGLGSVKSNIGHAELAAGVAGVIKVLLQMRHQTLVRSIHCDAINPHIDLEDTPFEVVRETRAWERCVDRNGDPVPFRAGVSSFGVGGVNAHIVLEEHA